MYGGHLLKRAIYGFVSVLSCTGTAFSPLSASHASADSAPSKATFAAIAKRYLQRRADQLTPAGGGRRTSDASTMGGELARTFAQEAVALTRRRDALRLIDGGYRSAEVEVTPGALTVDGSRARLDVTEYTELFFASVAAGAPSDHEAYVLPHDLEFLRSDGVWRVTADHARVAPGGPPPGTRLESPPPAPPTPDDPAPRPGDGPPADTRRPADAARGDVPMVAQGLGARGKAAAVWYAEKYWYHHNSAYRTYAQDCTNFISQAMRQGGWRFIGSGFWSRKDKTKWYYGSNTHNTSHTWANANDWGIFARDKSHRTARLGNVWYLKPGDVLQADFDAGSGKDHSMIVVAWDRRGERYLDYHSNDTWHRKLSYLLQQFPHARWYAHRT